MGGGYLPDALRSLTVVSSLGLGESSTDGDSIEGNRNCQREGDEGENGLVSVGG